MSQHYLRKIFYYQQNLLFIKYFINDILDEAFVFYFKYRLVTMLLLLLIGLMNYITYAAVR